VDTGNPHALFFADCSATEFYSLAPSLVKQIAPEGINLSLLKKINDQHYHLTPFERGVGPTPACSSAAIALISWLSPSQEITIDMPGGKLIATLQDEKVFLTAPWPQCDLPYQIENKHEKSYTL
jgi:diaminopimelate epimerase